MTVQQNGTIYSLFISANCSTCFGWCLHLSSVAHYAVSTVSGSTEAVTATYRERGWMETANLLIIPLCEQAVSKPVWHIPLLCVQWETPDDGQRNCPKHVEFYSKNKFWKISESSWFYYKILLRCTVTWTSNSGLVVWAIYLFKITFRTGCKILFRRILRRGQRVPCWLGVLPLCCWQDIHVLFKDADIFFFGTTKPARNIWTYFVSKIFHDCIIFNTVI